MSDCVNQALGRHDVCSAHHSIGPWRCVSPGFPVFAGSRLYVFYQLYYYDVQIGKALRISNPEKLAFASKRSAGTAVVRRSILMMMMTLTWFLVVPAEHVQCVYTSTASGDSST